MQQQPLSINNRPQDAYRRQDVMTASPIDLVVMLYDALKKNIVLGQRGIAKGNTESTHKHLIKAQEIISELINSLDMNYQISEELLVIYEFILRCLEEANIRKSAEPLEGIGEIVDTLRDAWREISESSKGSLYMKEEKA